MELMINIYILSFLFLNLYICFYETINKIAGFKKQTKTSSNIKKTGLIISLVPFLNTFLFFLCLLDDFLLCLNNKKKEN